MLKNMEISGLIKLVKVNVKARDHESVLKEMFTGLLEAAGPKTFRSLEAHESSEGALAGTGGAIFHCLAEEAQSIHSPGHYEKGRLPKRRQRREGL
jgi:hypothetical protein